MVESCGLPTQTISSTYTDIKQSSDDENCNISTQKDMYYKSFIGTFKSELKWSNIISITILHLLTVWGVLAFPYSEHKRLCAYTAFVIVFTGLGVTGGAHRLWTHRSYKAKLPLRIFMMYCYTLAAQYTMFEWVRDHRVHHKFSETDADPHNSKRGFFFAHVGWLMMKKHPEVIRRGKEVDMTDVLTDPVVQLHLKYFSLFKLLFGFVIPSSIPPLLWGESWFWSIMAISVIRYAFSLNFTWSVNSAAHIWGNKPYDRNIKPSQNLGVSIVALGEGWHNYHHTFPWDYKTAELWNYNVNLTTLFIDLCAKIGWAYDRKTASADLIRKVALNRGDGSRSSDEHFQVNEVGGVIYNS